jgi:hypothetical protein
MKIAVTHDHTYIEKAWKHAEIGEIEDLAANLWEKHKIPKTWRTI